MVKVAKNARRVQQLYNRLDKDVAETLYKRPLSMDDKLYVIQTNPNVFVLIANRTLLRSILLEEYKGIYSLEMQVLAVGN